MIHFDFKKFLKNFRRMFSRAGEDPYFDWGAILILSFIAAAVFIGFGARLFIQVSLDANKSAVTVAASSALPAGPILDTTDLNSLISIFQSKAAQAPVFASGYPGPSDPAVPLAVLKTPAPTASATSSSKTASKTPLKSAAK